MAERLGFEPRKEVAPLPVFMTGAFNRSAISPYASFYKYNIINQQKTEDFISKILPGVQVSYKLSYKIL